MSIVVMMADISLGIAVNDTRIARIIEGRGLRGSRRFTGRGLRGSRRVHGTRNARITKGRGSCGSRKVHGTRIARITKGRGLRGLRVHGTRIMRITRALYGLVKIDLTVATRRSDLVTMRHGAEALEAKVT